MGTVFLVVPFMRYATVKLELISFTVMNWKQHMATMQHSWVPSLQTLSLEQRFVQAAVRIDTFCVPRLGSPTLSNSRK